MHCRCQGLVFKGLRDPWNDYDQYFIINMNWLNKRDISEAIAWVDLKHFVGVDFLGFYFHVMASILLQIMPSKALHWY